MKRIFAPLMILLTFMANAQLVWEPDQIVNTGHGMDRPRVVFNAGGKPIVIWGEYSKLMYSYQSGGTMTPPMQLNPTGTSVAEAFWQGPEIAAKGDTIYIVYKTKPEADTSSHIYCLSSFNGGQSFNQPVRVDYIGNNMGRLPTVGITNNGQPVVAFMKSDLSYHDPQWVVVTSTDHGQSFSTEVQASGFNSAAAEACDCCPASIQANGTHIVLAYRDNDNNLRDTWLGISNDGGNSFNNVRVDTSNWFIQACPSSGPDLVLEGDTVFSTFMNGQNQTRSFLSKYSMADSALAVESLEAVAQYQNYPRISSAAGGMVVTWVSTVSSSSLIKMNYYDGNVNTYVLDTGNLNVPDIVMDDQSVAVVWHDFDNTAVVLKQATRGYVGEGEDMIPETVISPNPAHDIIYLNEFGHVDQVQLINMTGAVVLHQDRPEEMIRISDLPVGVYTVRFVVGNEITFRRLVKN